MSSLFGSSLLIDDNLKFVDEVKKDDKQLEKFPCFFAKNIKDAKVILKNTSNPVRVIFLSATLGRTNSKTIFDEIRSTWPQIPIVLLSHNPAADSPELLDPNNGYYRVLSKPTNYDELLVLIKDILKKDDGWQRVNPTAEEKFVEVELPEAKYIPHPISEFVITPRSFFNIYIKIGSSRFIKVLNAGDPIQADFLENYHKKNITVLYISEDEQEKYIGFYSQISEKTVKKDSLDNNRKANVVLNLGSSIAQSMVHTGISMEKLDYANVFLNQSVSIIRNMKMQNGSLKKLIQDICTQDHSANVSFLAGLIANEVGFESTKSVKLVGIAALVHDIGLYDLAPDFEDENSLASSPEMKDIFDRHPQHGAELLRQAGFFEETICQTVAQHHLRRRGNDPRIRANNINFVTEIVAVADELFNSVMYGGYSDEKLKLFTSGTLSDFSPAIEKGVMKLLNKK